MKRRKGNPPLSKKPWTICICPECQKPEKRFQVLSLIACLTLTFLFLSVSASVPFIAGAQNSGSETPAPAAVNPPAGNTLSEEERLKALQADIDKKITTYNDILTRLEELLSKVPEAEAARLKTLVKAYDAMSTEDAARNLSEIDEDLAVKILLKMNSRKAGAAMGQMEVKKAASLTEKMSTITKFLPVK
ncbi:MAG: hypothetical protein HQK89_02005 [Nitrospirae bacterium]|nr:hypothetical protein [Nitrospirota bacterium]